MAAVIDETETGLTPVREKEAETADQSHTARGIVEDVTTIEIARAAAEGETTARRETEEEIDAQPPPTSPAAAIAINNLGMENQGNLYIEPNQIKDERKSGLLSKKLAEMGCIDQDMRIIVQRVEQTAQKNPGKHHVDSIAKPDVTNRLGLAKNPDLQKRVAQLLMDANNDINFSSFDNCYKHICEAINLIERSA